MSHIHSPQSLSDLLKLFLTDGTQEIILLPKYYNPEYIQDSKMKKNITTLLILLFSLYTNAQTLSKTNFDTLSVELLQVYKYDLNDLANKNCDDALKTNIEEKHKILIDVYKEELILPFDSIKNNEALYSYIIKDTKKINMGKEFLFFCPNESKRILKIFFNKDFSYSKDCKIPSSKLYILENDNNFAYRFYYLKGDAINCKIANTYKNRFFLENIMFTIYKLSTKVENINCFLLININEIKEYNITSKKIKPISW